MTNNTSYGQRVPHTDRFVVTSTDMIRGETWSVVRDTQTGREYLWVGNKAPILMSDEVLSEYRADVRGRRNG